MIPLRWSVWTLLIILLYLAGCAPRTYWDENWLYEGITTAPEEQTLQVESDPPAALWVDGRYVSRTPAAVTLTYPVSEIRLLKNQYRESPGGEKEILETKEKQETMSRPTPHLLRFSAPGYHDLIVPAEIPHETGTLQVRLRKKAGIHFKTDCVLTVKTRLTYFPRIEEIITEHALDPNIGKNPAEPVPLGEPDMYEQTFRFTVRDAGTYTRLTDTLFGEARDRHVVFNVSEARTEATLSTNPAREFRAVWVSYLDWPDKQDTVAEQKAALREMLDTFKQLNINAVLLQVRAEADALYASDIEPWSARLTGTQGKNPGYDPLSFAVTEAHHRGMELHAWLNPYRTRLAKRCSSGSGNFAKGHVVRSHPDWVIRFRLQDGKNACYEMLDPGIPAVTDHVTRVVGDIVRRYDVDGIHFDDMFYPYPVGGFGGVRGEDRDTFRQYGRGRGSIGDWRRENVNRLVRQVNEEIKAVKAHVRFGISPFGIWQRNSPSGTVGMSAYDAIYSDALAWLEEKSIDYLTPQLYWNTGGNPDYEKLLPWWAEKVKRAGRHIYPGQIVYYVRTESPEESGSKPRSPYDIIRQVHLNRDNRSRNVLGNAFYRAVGEDGELLGPEALKAMLREGLYATPALPPVMPWLDTDAPDAPVNIVLKPEGRGGVRLTWDNTDASVRKYAVYAAFQEDLTAGKSLEDAASLIGVTGEPSLTVADGLHRGDVLLVTAVSRNNVESDPGKPVRIE